MSFIMYQHKNFDEVGACALAPPWFAWASACWCVWVVWPRLAGGHVSPGPGTLPALGGLGAHGLQFLGVSWGLS